ncbi:MAG: class I SAM-dependent methyltransferase [Acidobacteriota bacterium]|nr:class I SAM-dependent methyltransferase [Acidobacteriota bacterium]
MRQERHFIKPLYKKTERDYVGRVTEADKAACAEVALQWGRDYWDGDRKYGYGGYRYDGRWEVVARAMIEAYRLKPGCRILDVGCGKAFLLYEFKKLMPELEVAGLDISGYALEHAKDEVKPYLVEGNATRLPFPDNHFDLVISVMTLHNLELFDLQRAFAEIERVSFGDAYFLTESYRNEREKMNLLYWQLTCQSFFSDREWKWLFETWGYSGDYEFFYFE